MVWMFYVVALRPQQELAKQLLIDLGVFVLSTIITLVLLLFVCFVLAFVVHYNCLFVFWLLISIRGHVHLFTIILINVKEEKKWNKQNETKKKKKNPKI